MLDRSSPSNLDSPRRTLVEVGSGIGGFSWTSTNALKGQGILNLISSSQSHTSKPITADTLSDSYLASLGRSSDCFRKAAGSIQTRCAELDMNEEERVVAAISMTLCELATAKHHSPPMECDVFSARLHEPSYQSGFSEQQNEEFENSRGKCVNALSRSAQFWSSYSGYLREIRESSLLRFDCLQFKELVGQPNCVLHFREGTILVRKICLKLALSYTPFIFRQRQRDLQEHFTQPRCLSPNGRRPGTCEQGACREMVGLF
ncbi:hypothetical protein DFH05DRAFT_1400010 [Lentinula detonsa]|uniref:Uncharacterized protein n=1 Tax=Lentinula detonsa TaxID=2804962 RepID=A0A9W8TX30_9AGAR|nr:hypothetical protein DFH05DRAFT_1400010 [Lentinula detonsa]